MQKTSTLNIYNMRKKQAENINIKKWNEHLKQLCLPTLLASSQEHARAQFTPCDMAGQRIHLRTEGLNVLSQTSFRVLQVLQRAKRNVRRRRRSKAREETAFDRIQRAPEEEVAKIIQVLRKHITFWVQEFQHCVVTEKSNEIGQTTIGETLGLKGNCMAEKIRVTVLREEVA